MSAIVLGVAAQVAITSFRDTLNHTIDNQARDLLGADLVFEKRSSLTSADSSLIDSISSQTASEIRFASMVYQPNGTGTRLSQIRALSGPFPFYGTFQTTPAHVFDPEGTDNVAVIDESLLLQFNASLGDSIAVGNRQYKIAGVIEQVPGEAAIVSVFGPRVYIPRKDVIGSPLLQRGSRVEYRVYVKLAGTITPADILNRLREHRKTSGLRYDTIEERKEDFGEAVANMAKFLNMVGFIALLLGGLGIASSIHVYIKNKVSTIAILHCVGSSTRQTLLIYLVQALILGAGGAVIGSLLGLGIQFIFPLIFSDFLPVEVDYYFSPLAVSVGLSTGIFISVLFALIPLLSIRNISPLNALRSAHSNLSVNLPRSIKGLIYFLIVAFIGLYAFFLTQNIAALYFTAGILIAFIILYGVAKGLIFLTNSLSFQSWSYIWRQGIANLYRPNNQTVSLVLTLGLGALLIFSMIFSQQMLMNELKIDRDTDQANLVFFDIQSDQIDPLTELLQEKQFPVIQKTPVVTMRLEKLNGKTLDEIRKDTAKNINSWPFRHEYRVTYRDSLVNSEKLQSGRLADHYKYGLEGTIPVTLADNVFEDLNASVGDTLLFNVQGMPVETYISGVREVDWQRVQPNFLVVFPTGVLESAPQIYIAVTRVKNDRQLASIQNAVVSQFPNVSAINLQMILDTVQNFLDKISFVIQFMALFSIFTGLLVLLSSVALSRYQRLKESVLLKTLGASKKQVIKINGVEYLLIGLLASITGFIIAIAASWMLGYFYFNLVFTPNWLPVFAAIIFFCLLIITVGMFASRDLFRKPPLEILRLENV